MNMTTDIQAVVFSIGGERFALPVEMVREILDHREAAHLPGAPDWLLGLTDVRGQSVPMVDLRLRLGLAPADVTLSSRVLVVELPRPSRAPASGQGSPLLLGLLVDRVLDVCAFPATTIEGVPDIGSRWRADFIRAVMRRDDGFVILLDSDGIFADEADLSRLAADAPRQTAA